MSTINPYEPPKARLEGAVRMDGGDCWRDGRQLVVRPGCTLPDRCIKCNEPAEHPLQSRRFYWHHPALYLLVLVDLLIYLVVAVIVVRRSTRRLAGNTPSRVSTSSSPRCQICDRVSSVSGIPSPSESYSDGSVKM